jgi:hypothetical protein
VLDLLALEFFLLEAHDQILKDHNHALVLVDYFYRYITKGYLELVSNKLVDDFRLFHFHVGTSHNLSPTLNLCLRVNSSEYTT